MGIVLLTNRNFYKHITSILKMPLEEAVKYIDSSLISHRRFIDYADDYLYYNPDFLSSEKLAETKKFLDEVRVLHLANIKEKEEEKKEKEEENKEDEKKSKIIRNKNIDGNINRIDNEIYIKNRYLLEEYVSDEEYVFTILKKYKKDYTFFMNLVGKAAISNNSYDKDLYKKVSNLLASKEYKVNQDIESITPLLLGYIHEGIKIGNELVIFSILDYYANFSIPIEYFFLYQGENISEGVINEIISFFREDYYDLRADYAFANPENIIQFNAESKLKTEYTFNVNGEYIKPSLEERKKIMNYLIENKFPTDLIIYKQALKRYANGLFEFKPLKRTFE